MSLEKATRGELAILRTAAENAGSGRIRLQSSIRDVSVPDMSFSALSATAGKGGRLSGSQVSPIGFGALAVPVATVIAFLQSGRLRFQYRKRGAATGKTPGLPRFLHRQLGRIRESHEGASFWKLGR